MCGILDINYLKKKYDMLFFIEIFVFYFLKLFEVFLLFD